MPGSFRFRFGWGLLDFEASSPSSDGPGTATLFDADVNYTPGPPLGLRRLVLKWTRAYSGAAEDRAICDLTFLNVTSGAPDDTWTNADYAAIETAAAAFWTSLRPNVHSSATLEGGDWYKVVPPGVASPRLRTFSIGTAGSSGGDPLPPQVAMSCTLKTQVRKRWGRIYLPSWPETANDAGGRPASATVTAVAGYLGTFLSAGIASQGIYPVVWSRVMQGAYSVETVQVDNVWDVIRSRRFAQPSQRATATIA